MRARLRPLRPSRAIGAIVSALAMVAIVAIGAVPIAVPSAALALTVSGRVVKGTDRVPTAGVPVSLHVVRENQELPGKTVTSGPDGAFRFTGVSEEPGLEHYVSTEYEGAFYTEGPIEVAGKQAVTQDLQVYDVGREFDAIHVLNHHIIVERKQDGLHVTEIMVFQNGASTAFLGVGVNHAQASGARVGLPASIKDFHAGIGGDEQTVQVQGREMTSLRPIPPGQRPFSFTYHVPLSGRMDLSHRLYFPTHQFVVMLDDATLHVESPALKAGGTREQGGKTYTLYTGSDLTVGSEVEIRVNGAGFFSNPTIYPWLAAPAVMAVIFILAARRGRKSRAAAGAAQSLTATPTPTPMPIRPAVAAPKAARRAPASPGSPGSPGSPASPASGDDFAQVYLYLIASLDQGLERGEFSEESHALIRGNLKRRLETILADEPRAGIR